MSKSLWRYTRKTCPKSDIWFVQGGRCGWANCCNECEADPERPKAKHSETQMIQPPIEEDASTRALRIASELASLKRQMSHVLEAVSRSNSFNELPEQDREKIAELEQNLGAIYSIPENIEFKLKFKKNAQSLPPTVHRKIMDGDELTVKEFVDYLVPNIVSVAVTDGDML